MKTYIASLVFLMLSGCGNPQDMKDALKAFNSQCDGNITAELYFGSYSNNHISFKCDNFKKE